MQLERVVPDVLNCQLYVKLGLLMGLGAHARESISRGAELEQTWGLVQGAAAAAS